MIIIRRISPRETAEVAAILSEYNQHIETETKTILQQQEIEIKHQQGATTVKSKSREEAELRDEVISFITNCNN